MQLLQSNRTLFKLDSRLSLCAEFVRSSAFVADVGTDHGYLPVWLCLSGKITNAIASDINEKPLLNALKTIQKYKLKNNITILQSDGLKGFHPYSAEDIVIAGMGGETIASIISSVSWVKSENIRLILQPMTKSELLIKYLCDNQFQIYDQKACVSHNKVYTAFLAGYTGRVSYCDEVFYYAGKLNPQKSEYDKLFIYAHINRLIKKSINDDSYFHVIKCLKTLIR